jgi:hypothetical protein
VFGLRETVGTGGRNNSATPSNPRCVQRCAIGLSLVRNRWA